MPRILPYKGTSHARLSQLIRDGQNPVLPSNVNFEFGQPSQGPHTENPGSTTIATVAYAPQRRDPSIDIDFFRLAGDAPKRLPPGELIPFDPILFPTSVHAILPQINQALGLDLVDSEVEDTALPTLPVNGLTIKILPGSLAWLPGEYMYGYAPNSIQPARVAEGGALPVDERRRIRVLEKPITSA